MFPQVDVHVDGGLVESLTEPEPDAPVLEAPPAVEDDAPDAGQMGRKYLSALVIHDASHVPSGQ